MMLQVRRRRQWGGPRRAVWQRQGSAKRSEKRDREEITKKAARGSQIRLFEQQQLTDRVCEKPWAGGSLRRKRERAEKREKRENGRKLDSLHFYRAPWPPRKSFENQRGARKWPQARIPAFLRCPVNTSQRTEKTPSSFRGCLSQKF